MSDHGDLEWYDVPEEYITYTVSTQPSQNNNGTTCIKFYVYMDAAYMTILNKTAP